MTMALDVTHTFRYSVTLSWQPSLPSRKGGCKPEMYEKDLQANPRCIFLSPALRLDLHPRSWGGRPFY